MIFFVLTYIHIYSIKTEQRRRRGGKHIARLHLISQLTLALCDDDWQFTAFPHNFLSFHIFLISSYIRLLLAADDAPIHFDI